MPGHWHPLASEPTLPKQHRERSSHMSKSKNASQHNNSAKAHRNGIKKPKNHRYPSMRGVDSKFRRNHRWALHGTAKALAAQKAGEKK